MLSSKEDPGINISVDISACLCVWSWGFPQYFYHNQLTLITARWTLAGQLTHYPGGEESVGDISTGF